MAKCVWPLYYLSAPYWFKWRTTSDSDFMFRFLGCYLSFKFWCFWLFLYIISKSSYYVTVWRESVQCSSICSRVCNIYSGIINNHTLCKVWFGFWFLWDRAPKDLQRRHSLFKGVFPIPQRKPSLWCNYYWQHW